MSVILQDKVFKVSIHGHVWNVYLIEEHDHHILDEGDYAETDFEAKELYFRKTTFQIVLHELIHVFIFYTYTNTANLTALQNEELCAEVISWNWGLIDKLSLEIYNGLVDLKKYKPHQR
jgi:hypothetical protein